jgi:hypothetical protein
LKRTALDSALYRNSSIPSRGLKTILEENASRKPQTSDNFDCLLGGVMVVDFAICGPEVHKLIVFSFHPKPR